MCLVLVVLIMGPTVRAADLDLRAYQGKVVYLDFWASWCAPCKQSFPWMQRMSETYGGQGFAVIAVNVEINRADADKFLERVHPTFDVRFDPKGELPEIYKVQAMPSSVLIDRHGTKRFRHEGFRPDEIAVYEAQVRELLAEK